MRCSTVYIYRSLKFFLVLVLVASLYVPSLPLGIRLSFAAEETGEVSSFQIQPGGRLKITVYREQDLSGVYEVDPSGKLTFPLIGEIQVAGLRIGELRDKLISDLKKYLVNPQVGISRAEDAVKSISVLGHVAKPGTYDYAPGSTLMRLISAAGGFSESANKRKIKIVRAFDGKKKIIIVNGSDIINGEAADPPIEAGDIVFVPESIF